MDKEHVRVLIVAGIDRILGHPLFISSIEAKLLHAQRAFWITADAEIDKLLGYLPKGDTQ